MGQSVYVVGSIPQLGGWNVANAIKLDPNVSPTWTGVTPWIIAGIEAGGTALSSAEIELRNMARLADRWNAEAPALFALLQEAANRLECCNGEGEEDDLLAAIYHRLAKVS